MTICLIKNHKNQVIKKLPKLLDFIKELGITHEEVMLKLKEKSTTEIEEVEEEAETTIEEPAEEGLHMITTPERDAEIAAEKAQKEEIVEDTETITLTKEELEKKIADGIADELKSERKIPSKGKIFAEPQSNVAVIKKNWFEVIV